MWPILLILLQAATAGTPAWALLWLIDRLCHKQADPEVDSDDAALRWIADDLARVVDSHWDKVQVTGTGHQGGLIPSLPMTASQVEHFRAQWEDLWRLYLAGVLTIDEVRERIEVNP